MDVQEKYGTTIVPVNTTVNVSQGTTLIGGFLCITSGTLTVTNRSGGVVINAVPVTAGVFTPMPFHIGGYFSVTTAGGASGVLAVG